MEGRKIGCIVCQERIAWARGVCSRCYGRLKGRVQRGKTTWAALVAAGQILAAKPSRHWGHKG